MRSAENSPIDAIDNPGHANGPDIRGARLDKADYAHVFDDLHPPLTKHEALVESDRCYFCYDAPCMNACPTGIDIPMFIRQINAGNPVGAAKTILSENILGGMCARVCPTETLCEEVCVREISEGKPVKIGELQRYATDVLMETGNHPFKRAPETDKHIAVVGAGPAGISAAHRLAMHGHKVTIFEARPKGGGLNEYGIAAYKTVNNFAQRELEFVLKIGAINVEYNQTLGQDITIEALKAGYDAVFLGMGMPGVNDLGLWAKTRQTLSMRSTTSPICARQRPVIPARRPQRGGHRRWHDRSGRSDPDQEARC